MHGHASLQLDALDCLCMLGFYHQKLLDFTLQLSAHSSEHLEEPAECGCTVAGYEYAEWAAHPGGLCWKGDAVRATCCAADGIAIATSRSGTLWSESSSSCWPCPSYSAVKTVRQEGST